MKTTQTLLKSFLLLTLLIVAGGFTNRAHAQYQSFFGDSITEYAIQGNVVGFISDYDPHYLAGQTINISIYKEDTMTIGDFCYYGNGIYTSTERHIYIREDCTLGRLYRYDPSVGTEYLTCDMSLSVGDTFWVPYDGYCLADGRTPVPIVADTIMYINGLKHIQFRTLYGCELGGEFIPCPTLYCEDIHHLPILFIEGIGPNFSPFGWYDFDDWGQCHGSWFTADNTLHCDYWYNDNPFLLCVHKDGELVFMSDERAGCWQPNGGLVNDDNKKAFTLYPNPTRNVLNIEFENLPVQKGVLYITDMVGRVVYSQETAEQHLKINVKRFQSGLYVVTWIAGGKKQSVKFVKK